MLCMCRLQDATPDAERSAAASNDAPFEFEADNMAIGDPQV